jgi:hypothetical protein
MEDRIDHALKVINLRSKLQRIEVRKKKYPATDEGRRKYIQDSLKSENKNRNKFSYYFMVLIGIAGMVVSFVICLHDKGSFLLAILSMVAVLLGIHGLKERREP